MEELRWGIIGPGSIARDFADDLKLANGKQKVTSVLSHHPESANEFAEEYHIGSVHTKLSEFIKQKNFDVVYIATPHPLHYEEAKACLLNGIPVLCEKPMVINSQQAKELVDISRSKNTFLLEGMWIRFLPSITKVLAIVDSGEIGKIISVKASMSFLAPKDPSSRYFDPELGGGSLLDLGVYPVFLSHLLLGKPSSVSAVAKLSEKGIDEYCAAILSFPEDRFAIIESSIISKTELIAEIAGEYGTIKISEPWNEKPAGIVLIRPEKEKTEFPCNWKGKGFQFEAEEVMKCLRNNTIESSLHPQQLTLDIVTTMDEIRKQTGVRYHSFE
ncbi:MAG: Gfo/Idh/MocA family oxidoreductase [Flavitalea sp.]